MDALFDIEPFEDFKNAVDEVIDNLHTTEISQEKTINSAKDYLKQLLKEHNFNVDIVADTLRNRGDGNKVNYLITVLKERKKELLYKTLVKYNTLHGECVTNFDWTVKLAVGTSSLKTLKYSFLELLINSTTANGTQKETMYNIKKDVLERLIKTLEDKM